MSGTARYRGRVAGLNLRFTEEEPHSLRSRAAAEGKSTQAFAHDAVITAIDEHSRLSDEAADHVLKASEELNRRLALMECLARNRGLADGNKRIAWYATWVSLHMNGHPLDPHLDADEAERSVLATCQGALDMPKMAEQLPRFAR